MISILIIEDEEPISDYIKSLSESINHDKDVKYIQVETVEEALIAIKDHKIDLCLLDLNLYGKDGFSILDQMKEKAFETIIISAYRDKAIKAFENDVIDFVPKPFSKTRLEKAYHRYFTRLANKDVYRESVFSNFSGKIKRFNLADIHYFEASHVYITMVFKNGKTDLLDKSMNELENYLPNQFFRCHRSFIINLNDILEVTHKGGGNYNIDIGNDKIIPLSRKKYKELKLIITKPIS